MKIPNKHFPIFSSLALTVLILLGCQQDNSVTDVSPEPFQLQIVNLTEEPANLRIGFSRFLPVLTAEGNESRSVAENLWVTSVNGNATRSVLLRGQGIGLHFKHPNLGFRSCLKSIAFLDSTGSTLDHQEYRLETDTNQGIDPWETKSSSRPFHVELDSDGKTARILLDR